ncbi:nuclear speckle splicing regulatory protein 1-like [Mizuhopecten yessoensis]|uniref:Nuclear speckle splicing regulatory protein 1 n=1 Tax=Mizuhopecten yessoensis TaxID=6573 RepID=A0A210PIU4_MIZYE|nr:nuclear speckle splicing regulatory protein 1-like [Mizuhopecten yessoensis]OWF36421.1 Nuclear speckle splicing regulatory protein 1 [Mizuhopecten yessoensis]
MADTNKKYGLFLPKNKKSAVKTTNVFDDDSDDDLPGMARVNATINKEAQKSKVKRQTQLAIDQAMEQDPNVYEYDKIYDSMQNTKAATEEAAKAKKDNKPKYITNLMKAAEKRKLEQEKVQEKKIQKERETEGGEFDDKEVFVTGKYKEKLQEMEKEAERERREAAMEELLDVKKQKDMSGFYRYLLNEKTGESIHNGTDVKTEPETEVDTSRVKTEPESPEKSATTNRAKRNSSNDSSDDSSDPEQAEKRYEKGRNQSSRSPDRMKRSSEKRKRSRSRERRSSRSPNRSHREKDMNRSSDSKHRHSRRSRSNDRHSHKDKKHRSSSRDRISKSLKRSRSRDRKSKSKDKLSGSNEGSSKQQEEKVVLLPEKNTEEQSGKSEKSTKDSENKSKYTRHTTDKTLNDAKARYLARQIAKEKARSAVNTTGDN